MYLAVVLCDYAHKQLYVVHINLLLPVSDINLDAMCLEQHRN